MLDHDQDFLRQTIGQAATARQHGEFPFGAIQDQPTIASTE